MTESLDEAHHRTRTLINLDRADDAVSSARAGLARHPDDPLLVLMLAMALANAGRGDEALPVAERAVALQPDSAIAHRTLGWILHGRGRIRDGQEALDRLAHAISLDPHDARSHLMRGEALLKVAITTASGTSRRHRRLVAEAESHAAEAVRLRPGSADGHLLQARACVVAGDAAGAEAAARRGLALEADDPVGHQLLGLAARLRGDMRAAADHFVDAGKLNPKSDMSIQLLRGLRHGRIRGGALHRRGRRAGRAVAFLVLAGIVIGVAGLSGVPALTVMALATVLAFLVLWPGWWARISMSEEARSVLRRERELRRR